MEIQKRISFLSDKYHRVSIQYSIMAFGIYDLFSTLFIKFDKFSFTFICFTVFTNQRYCSEILLHKHKNSVAVMYPIGTQRFNKYLTVVLY